MIQKKEYIYIWCVSKLGYIFRILFLFFESSLQATTIWFFLCLENCFIPWKIYTFTALEKMWNWGVWPLTRPFWPLFGPIFSEKWKIHQLRALFNNSSKINIWKWTPFLIKARSAVSESPPTFLSANFWTEMMTPRSWDTFQNFSEKPIIEIGRNSWLKIAFILKSHKASIFYMFGQMIFLFCKLYFQVPRKTI